MMIDEVLAQKKMTKYRLSRESGIPYTTIEDICGGKTRLSKCSAETLYRLAKALDVSMESLLEPYLEERISFELFKSRICHQVRDSGDIDFMIRILENDTILEYYKRKWYPESFYLLAMLDYLSRQNNIPLCSRYDELRRGRLSKTVFPSSVLAEVIAAKDERIKDKAVKDAIPEFMRFNIVENEVRNVV